LADFPGQDQTTFNIVVNYPDGSPLTANRIAEQYTLERRIAAIPGVLRTSSIYDVDPRLGLFEYTQLYTGDPNNLPQPVRQLISSSVGKHVVLIQASTNAEISSNAARDIVKSIRADRGVTDGKVLVGGATAIDIDVIQFIYDQVPLAVGTVVLVTYVLLFLLTGSVVLPLKAVVLNFLSIGASFGALVFIFQQGHFANLLGFTPQSLDPSIPVILFSIVFGLSMDYEVLLVSRMHEEYVRLGDNTAAVASGLEKTGRLITGAAAVMFTVFMAFGLAEVVIIKAIGIGLAIAVAIDATIVRSLVVPAVMRLLGDLNWWAPMPLRRFYNWLGLGVLGVESDQLELQHPVASPPSSPASGEVEPEVAIGARYPEPLVSFSNVLTRGSIGRFVWYGMALVWVFALGVVLLARIPFGLVFGPLFLAYGTSGLVFRDEEPEGPLPWSEWLAPVLAVGFLVIGTVLLAASLALLS